MAGVAAPLIADDDVVLFGEQIDEFSFGLVSPLQTDDASNAQTDNLCPLGPMDTKNNSRLQPRPKSRCRA